MNQIFDGVAFGFFARPVDAVFERTAGKNGSRTGKKGIEECKFALCEREVLPVHFSGLRVHVEREDAVREIVVRCAVLLLMTALMRARSSLMWKGFTR